MAELLILILLELNDEWILKTIEITTNKQQVMRNVEAHLSYIDIQVIISEKGTVANLAEELSSTLAGHEYQINKTPWSEDRDQQEIRKITVFRIAKVKSWLRYLREDSK